MTPSTAPPQLTAQADSVFVTDAGGEVVFSNRYAESVVGRRLTDLADDFPMFHLDGRPYSYAERQVPRSLSSGEEILDEEFFGPDADGERVRYRCSSWPVYGDDGRIVAAVAVTRDVTEQARQEDRLTYLAGLLENTEDGVVAMDERYFLTVWNGGAERLYGWTAAEVVGRNANEVARTNLSEQERTELRRQLAERGRWRGEVAVARKDGTTADVELVSVALRDEEGAITGYLTIHRDIGERKRAEDALRASQRQRETILESITDAFCAWDRGWRFTYVNDLALRRIEEVMGRRVDRDEVLGAELWEMFPHLVGTEFERRYRQVMRDGRPAHFEARAAGDHWVEVHVYPSESGLSLYHRIVTERKRVEQDLRESHRRIEAILESISDEFFAVDREWRYTYVNERALAPVRRYVGRDIPAEELLGADMWEFFPEYAGTAIEREFHRAMREQRPVEFETKSEATGRWMEIRIYPSREGLSSYSRDISERKRAEEETRRREVQQALVADLGLRALATDELQPLLDDAVRLVARTLDVELVGVVELLPGGEELLLRAGVGWTGAEVGEATAVAGTGSLLHFTIVSGEPVMSEDFAADDRFEISPLLAGSGALSGATVVIAGRDEPFGSLGAFSRQSRAFSDYDIDFLQAVANVLATAVERTQEEERLVEVREAERQRLARDLHDQALQELTQALAVAQASDPRIAGPLVPVLKRVARQLRGAIYDLRLDEQAGRPFTAQLEELIALHGAMADGCEIELDAGEGTPSGSLGRPGVEVLRIVAEALTNARRHSGARHIRVATWGSEQRICVEVSDDGVGFDAARAPSRGAATGIIGMRERAGLIGADLTITSDPDAGSAVRVGLALTQEDARQARIRVLLVEDHAAVREAIAVMFDRAAGFEVVGQAGSLAEARTMLENVDVALVDLGLPDGFGGDLIRELHDVNPRAHAVVLSAGLQRRETARAIESGAAGALDKTASLDEVVDAVRTVQAGGALVPLDEIVELLRLAARERGREHRNREAVESLSPREREVLQLLAEGLESQEIASQLHITVRTERNHVASIFGKLGVHSRLQAVLFALRQGIVKGR